MLRCKSPSSAELIEFSEELLEEASEAEVTLAEASEVAGTEESWSKLIGNLRVEESSTSEFSFRRTEEKEEEGSEGETCDSGSWVREWYLLGRRGLGFQIRFLGFGLGALLGLALGEFLVFGKVLSLDIDVCLGLDLGFGLVLDLWMTFYCWLAASGCSFSNFLEFLDSWFISCILPMHMGCAPLHSY